MAKSEGPKTKEYVLKPGNIHHGFDGEGGRHQFVGGQKDNDRVQLSDQQYKAFKDKFESLEEQKTRQKAQDEVNELRLKQAKIEAKMAEKGITMEEFLNEETTKKPDPTPSVGTAEPTPANVTPAPVGSTSDPVNAPNPKASETGKVADTSSTAAKK